MTTRRTAALLLLVCLLAPTAYAGELMMSAGWLPDWLLDLIQLIRDSLGSDIPANTSEKTAPYIVPIG